MGHRLDWSVRCLHCCVDASREESGTPEAPAKYAGTFRGDMDQRCVGRHSDVTSDVRIFLILPTDCLALPLSHCLLLCSCLQFTLCLSILNLNIQPSQSVTAGILRWNEAELNCKICSRPNSKYWLYFQFQFYLLFCGDLLTCTTIILSNSPAAALRLLRAEL